MLRTWIIALAVAVLMPLNAAAAEDNCYLIVAGREATADGSVLLGHNEDNGTDKLFRFRAVEREVHQAGEYVELFAGGRLEQADTTWAYTVWEMPGQNFSHGMVNEHAVAVVSNNCPSREDRPELTGGGIGPKLRWLVVERARTARQGAKLVGALVERYGYSASGRTLTVADPREAWQVAMVNGRHWVARRVPDNQVAALANSYAIHDVDLADTLNFMGSGDLISYAVSRGWYDPSQGEKFDFEKAYAEQRRLSDPNQRMRQWTGLRHFYAGDFAMPADGRSLPFSVVPKEPVTRQMLYGVLRDHYEGSPLEKTGCPLHERCEGRPSTVCSGATNHGDVLQLRADVPAPLRAVWWYSFWRPCNSPFLPLFPGAGNVPEELAFEVPEHVFLDPASGELPGRDKAIRMFYDLTMMLDKSDGVAVDQVRERWAEFEQEQDSELDKLTQDIAVGQRKLVEFSSRKLRQAMMRAEEILGGS